MVLFILAVSIIICIISLYLALKKASFKMFFVWLVSFIIGSGCLIYSISVPVSYNYKSPSWFKVTEGVNYIYFESDIYNKRFETIESKRLLKAKSVTIKVPVNSFNIELSSKQRIVFEGK